VRRGDDARGIAFDVADHQIELRHDTTQLPRLAQSDLLPKWSQFMKYPSVAIWSH
jgi:hypothetical protein